MHRHEGLVIRQSTQLENLTLIQPYMHPHTPLGFWLLLHVSVDFARANHMPKPSNDVIMTSSNHVSATQALAMSALV